MCQKLTYTLRDADNLLFCAISYGYVFIWHTASLTLPMELNENLTDKILDNID